METGKVNLQVCPKCKAAMQIISFIENMSEIREILQHLGTLADQSLSSAKAGINHRRKSMNPPSQEYVAAFGGDMLRKPARCATCSRNEH
jgi:hypothetical protein